MDRYESVDDYSEWIVDEKTTNTPSEMKL